MVRRLWIPGRFYWLVVILMGQAAAAQRLMIELDVNGESLAGTPVDWSGGEVLLLGRDGRLWDFAQLK